MRILVLATLALALASMTPAKAKDHSDEYKSGKLIAMESSTSNKTQCTNYHAGLLGSGSNCDSATVHVYRVRIDDTLYTLRPKYSSESTTYPDWIKNGDDPLRAIAPDAEFRYRVDEKGKFKIFAPMEHGRRSWPFHEAEYEIISKEKAPTP